MLRPVRTCDEISVAFVTWHHFHRGTRAVGLDQFFSPPSPLKRRQATRLPDATSCQSNQMLCFHKRWNSHAVLLQARDNKKSKKSPLLSLASVNSKGGNHFRLHRKCEWAFNVLGKVKRMNRNRPGYGTATHWFSFTIKIKHQSTRLIWLCMPLPSLPK